MSKPFYVTTPIYYVNGQAHIGHAYTTIAADVLYRFKKICGYDAFFATGTDEHGQKVAKAAEAQGRDPQEFTDEVAQTFVQLWKDMQIEPSDFIRTTDARHKAVVSEFLQTLYDKGDIYKGQYEGWYCVPCEAFFPEGQLIEGNCPDCGRKVEKLQEDSYFFRLSKYQDWLIDHLKTSQSVRPVSKQNEVLSFLKNPLEDLCISRPKSRLSWGIPLPFDPEHVTYVWFDALVNYVSLLKGKDSQLFDRYWPCDVHLIGKDIIRPHAVYWPIMLHAMGYELSRKIFVHGWWTVKGEKMSKSKGNVLDPRDMAERYGDDAFRYFLLREVPFGSDGVFAPSSVCRRINTDLANDLGNFVSRSVGMLHKYCDGKVPQAQADQLTDLEADLDRLCVQSLEQMTERLDEVDFSGALASIWEYLRALNRYVQETSPWVLSKDQSARARLEAVMASLMKALPWISLMIDAFLPHAAAKIRDLFAELALPQEKDLDQSWQELYDGFALPEGTEIAKAKALFPRVDLEESEDSND